MIKDFFRRNTERAVFWLVWKLPDKICYFAFIRVVAFATTGKYGSTEVPKITAMDALKRWENDVTK